jgi:phage terminase small subunit
MTEHKPADTPKSLAAAGRKLWRETAKVYALRQDELESLKAACAEADLIERMEEELKDQPLTVTGSQGQIVAHPLVQELRQHRTTMASLLRGLKLPDDDSVGKVNAQRSGGTARWAHAHGKAS